MMLQSLIRCQWDVKGNKTVCQGVGVPICPIQVKGAAKVVMPKGCIPFGQDRPSGISKSGVRCGSKCKVDPNMHEGKNEYKVPTSNSPPKGGSTVIPTQAGTVTQVTHKKKPVVNQWMNDHNPKPTAKDVVNRAI